MRSVADIFRSYGVLDEQGRHVNGTDTVFPDNIDRTHFSSWLSGFVDGEGCFAVRAMNDRKTIRFIASFGVNLRRDDVEVLRLIRSFFGCGNIHNGNIAAGRSGNPFARYQVTKIKELNDVIVPHFDKYPLLAKKKNDFNTFKLAVGLMSEINKRPKGGRISTWTIEEKDRMLGIINTMAEGRRYKDEKCS